MMNPVPTPSKTGGTSLRRLSLLIAVIAAAAGGVYAYFYYVEGQVAPLDPSIALREFTARLGQTTNLAPGYLDADGDQVADPPTDPAKLLNPAELTFTVVASDDPETAALAWKPFLNHLAAASGKKVSYLTSVPMKGSATEREDLRSTEMQLDAVREGHLHITAFNTGLVPSAVTTAGFVPLFAPASADGNFSYRMQVFVAKASPIQNPGELKGRNVALVALSSNSGGRAPLVLLREKYDLIPGRDYQYTFTGRHEQSVIDLLAGRVDAVCVADDLFAQAVAAGKFDADKVRSIYKSDPFPNLAFGVPHNLDPKIRAAIESAFQSFTFEGTSVGQLYAAEMRTRFVRVNYLKDFAAVRDSDAKLVKLFASP